MRNPLGFLRKKLGFLNRRKAHQRKTNPMLIRIDGKDKYMSSGKEPELDRRKGNYRDRRTNK